MSTIKTQGDDIRSLEEDSAGAQRHTLEHDAALNGMEQEQMMAMMQNAQMLVGSARALLSTQRQIRAVGGEPGYVFDVEWFVRELKNDMHGSKPRRV